MNAWNVELEMANFFVIQIYIQTLPEYQYRGFSLDAS